MKKMRRVVFLDRDSTLIHTYGKRPANTVEEVKLLPTVSKALGLLKEAGFDLMVVSNQGGVAKGFLTRQMVHLQNEAVNDCLLMEGGPKIDAFAFCPHPTTGSCSCRKPKPGMLLQLAEKFNVNLSASYMVGDMPTDIQAGKAAGVRGCMMVSNGEIHPANHHDDADASFPNLLQCAEAIIAVERELK